MNMGSFDASKRETFQQVGTFAMYKFVEPDYDPGFVRTTDGGAWLYRVVPDDINVLSARGDKDLDTAARPFEAVMQGLAGLVNAVAGLTRSVLKAQYRRIHILAVATPKPFYPDPKLDPEMRMMIGSDWKPGEYMTADKFTLIGVELYTGGREPTPEQRKRGPLGRAWAWVADQVIRTQSRMLGAGMPEDDEFAHDRKRIDFILRHAGCGVPSMRQMDRANAWWSTGRDPDNLPIMFEATHAHVFGNLHSMQVAQREQDHDISCRQWAPIVQQEGSYPVTFVTLGALEGFNGLKDHDRRARWGAQLLKASEAGGNGALAVSVRGLVEPGALTRRQIDKDAQNVAKQVAKQEEKEHDENSEIRDRLQTVKYISSEGGMAEPVLIDGSIIAAIPGVIDTTGQVGYPGVVDMNRDRQQEAFYSMEIGSTKTLNGQPVYWPAPIIANAGLSGVARAGDGAPGALLGFTEADRQPVYVNPFAQSQGDTLPLFTIIGNTGSGKTYAALHLASQWARMRNPDNPSEHLCGVFFDPKPQSDDWAPFVKGMGGRQVMLDDDAADGILDPLRCMGRPAMEDGKPVREQGMLSEAASTAVEMLSDIAHNIDDIDVNAMSILAHGIAEGETSVGGAVRRTYGDLRKGLVDRDSVAGVERLWSLIQRLRTNAAFRVICGLGPGQGLNVSEGLTLLSAGTLDVTGSSGHTAQDLIKRWVVRMAALGGAGAIMGRNGFVVIDEAWMLLGDEEGAKIVERFGRLARAQHYLPVLCSQKVDEFVDANLGSFIGRGLVLSMDSNNEQTGRMSQAQAACALFSQPTDGIMHWRLGQGKYRSMATREPNYDSLFALTDPDDGHLVRGSVGFYIEGSDRKATPVEISIPPAQMRLLKGKAARSFNGRDRMEP